MSNAKARENRGEWTDFPIGTFYQTFGNMVGGPRGGSLNTSVAAKEVRIQRADPIEFRGLWSFLWS